MAVIIAVHWVQQKCQVPTGARQSRTSNKQPDSTSERGARWTAKSCRHPLRVRQMMLRSVLIPDLVRSHRSFPSSVLMQVRALRSAGLCAEEPRTCSECVPSMQPPCIARKEGMAPPPLPFRRDDFHVDAGPVSLTCSGFSSSWPRPSNSLPTPSSQRFTARVVEEVVSQDRSMHCPCVL